MRTGAPLAGCEDVVGVGQSLRFGLGSNPLLSPLRTKHVRAAQISSGWLGLTLHLSLGGAEHCPAQDVDTGKPEELLAINLAPGTLPTACLYK